MPTAVLYARYSSDKQREASIDDQLRVCREYCDREGIEVLKIYADYALSGKTDQRPEFQRMINNAPESDYVVVYMFDRFSRDRYDSAMYKKELRDCGVRVVSASEMVDDSPEGGLQEGLLEILSEYYVRDLKRKVRRGMEGNALKAMDNGYKLFGYDTDPVTRKYIINEAEAEAVREIYSRYIAGQSMYAIAKEFAGRGWTTTKGSPVDYNWTWRVLNRKAYTGLYSWDGIEVEGGMPVIIDKNTFLQVSQVGRRKPREGEEWALYRLSGKLYCGFCGASMHGYGGTSKTGKRYYYYGCKEKTGCKRRGMRRELVEDSLAQAVLSVTSDKERMRMVAERVVEAYDVIDDTAAELIACENQMEALEEEQHLLTRSAMKGFVNDEMIARNEEIKNQLQTLRNRHGILASKKADLKVDEIVEFLAHGFDRSDENFIFGTFVNHVLLYQDYMIAVFNFRAGDGDLAQERIEIGQAKEENPNLTSGFGFHLSGVPGASTRELGIIALPGGFGLVIPLAA